MPGLSVLGRIGQTGADPDDVWTGANQFLTTMTTGCTSRTANNNSTLYEASLRATKVSFQHKPKITVSWRLDFGE